MSPLLFTRVPVSKLAFVSISIIFLAVALVWATGERAGVSASNLATSLSSLGVFVAADKGGITPQTTLTVNSLSDVANPSDGLCTLREAITAANSKAASGSVPGECAAGSGADQIILTGLSGTISLASALPNLSSNMTLTGAGPNQLTITRSIAAGTPDFRIFTIDSGRPVIMTGLTISNGKANGVGNAALGGGIFNGGSLTLNNCNLYGNTATNLGGGLYNTGVSATLTNCNVGGPGAGQPNSPGGISNNAGTLVMDGGSVVGNSGGPGVGLGGIATLNRVTITGNTNPGFFGGGVSVVISSTVSITNCLIANNAVTLGSNGGGIANNGNLRVVNSTVSGNSAAGAGGGIYNFNGNLTLTNSTVTANRSDSDNDGISSQNAGGLTPNGSVQLFNSIVAGNTFRSNVPNDITTSTGGMSSSSSFNLIGVCDACGLSNGVNSNQVGVSNPGLGPLADNGGPTKTHALLAGSPAFDAGSNTFVSGPDFGGPPVTDQRGNGFARLADGNGDGTATVDIGAYEVQTLLVTNVNDSGTGSLRQAITDANGRVGTDAINFQTGLNGTINLSSVLPDLTTSIAINGPGAALLTVQRSSAPGTPRFRIFNIQSSATVNLLGLTIANGLTPDGAHGSGIQNGGTLILTNSVVSGNQTGLIGFGGGIYNSGANLTLVNSLVSGNNANASGGGIHNNGGTVALTNSTVSANITNGSGANGGGIFNSVGTLTLTNCTVSGNSAPFAGGLANAGGTQTITNSTVSGNTATTGQGGAVYNAGGTLRLTNSTVSGNTAGNSGGGIFNSATLILTNVTISNNRSDFGVNAGVTGGGILSSAGTIAVKNTIVAGNFRGSGSTADDVNGPVNSTSSNNLIGDCSGCGLSNSTNSNQVGVSNALLGPLANNGGPTLTHALLANSPALEAGDNCVTQAAHCGDANIPQLVTDQRGLNRLVDGPDADTTATVDIGAYEMQPALAGMSDVVTNEDTPVQTVFDVGDSSTVTSITASSSNSTLVANDVAHLSVSSFGSTEIVTIAPATNLSGTTNILITVNRTGGGSESKTFGLTVNTVNDAPSFTIGGNQTVSAGAGPQTVTNWATNISAGPLDESSQTLTFQIVANTNPGLFSSSPAINSTGRLTYSPAANANGSATLTVNLKDDGGVANGGVDTSPSQIFTITVTPAGGVVSFASSTGNTTENSGSTTVTVVRTGNTSNAVTVNYATNADAGVPCSTANGVASPKCDFTAALGTLNFAAGETSKQITILISQDSFVEGPEAITLTLSSPTGGATLGATSTMSLTIADDASEPPTNVIDDPSTFVRMHYHDFLNREADQSGLNFWTGQMTNCGNSDLTVCRVNVSGAFFVSIEFQQTGYLVERMYKTGYGDATAISTVGGSHQITVPVVRANEFLTDTQRVGRGVVVNQTGWEAVLENNKQAYALEFVQTTRFMSAFPTSMTPAQFVDKLNTNAGNVLSASERTTAINLFGSAADTTNTNARAQVLRQVAEDTDLYNAEFNRAFVLTQFIGYLRRNPDDAPDSDYTGYDFWLGKLNQFNGDYIAAEMVKAFISSSEYRQRFGP